MVIPIETDVVAFVAAGHFVRDEDIRHFGAVAYPGAPDVHLHPVRETAPVHSDGNLGHESVKGQMYRSVRPDDDIVSGCIHGHTLTILIRISHVESHLFQFGDVVCIYLIAEVGACPEII